MNRLSVATSLIAERARRSDRRGILRHRALIRNSRLAGTRVKGLGTETRAVLQSAGASTVIGRASPCLPGALLVYH